jgi:hypothetical protein
MRCMNATTLRRVLQSKQAVEFLGVHPHDAAREAPEPATRSLILGNVHAGTIPSYR